MQARTLSSFLALGVLLASCAPQVVAPPPPPPPPPLPPHFGPPPAAYCKVAPFHVADGHEAEVLMTVGNDGGYCAATLTNNAGQAFDAGLVPTAAEPEHGTVRVVHYNGKTSVEYTPETGYAGHDHFVTRLIIHGTPGYTSLNVSISVVPK